MTSVVDRFIKYVQINTRSDLYSTESPSTANQFDLAKVLVEEMKEMGLQDVELTDKCYIYATLPANTTQQVPVIGLVAHLDTSPEAPGENVKPQVIEKYDGKAIVLDANNNVVLSPDEFPDLLKYVGQSLITSDGTTLLGADDKAGIASIMAALDSLIKHPEIPHGTIRVGITPDEEVARGTESFDVKKFGADFAYTIDGGQLGELEYECFNAAQAFVTIQGRNVHPGYAKDKMVNAIEVAMRFHSLLPTNERPEFTQGYEGFFHTYEFKGSVEEAELVYIIRDHDRQIFEHRKQVFLAAVNHINQMLGSERVKVKLIDQYQNMKEVILPTIHVVDTAKYAMELCGVVPKIGPIRGGTDGARLSYMGLPTPNIFAGGHNFHGKYEFLPIPSLEKSVEVILKVIELYTQHPEGIQISEQK